MKKIFILFACLLCLAMAGGTANACHFENISLTADCSGYTISGNGWADWSYHNGKVVTYELTLTSNDGPITVSGNTTINVDITGSSWFGVPFLFSGSWGQVP